MISSPTASTPGMVFTLGYTELDATSRLQALMHEPKMLLIDIRYRPHSRWYPAWNKRLLQANYGDRYRHVQELGNVNYRHKALPIRLFKPEAVLAQYVALVHEGWSLVLLCACKDYERCHRKTVYDLLMSPVT